MNLWGGSFGSRTALVYSRRFPHRVRTAILESPAPFELVFPLNVAADSQRALDRLFDDCASDPGCSEAFPDLREELASLLKALDRKPQIVRLTHPRRGTPVELTVDRHAVSQAIRGALYLPLDSSLIPFAIHSAARGDYATSAALMSRLSESAVETMSLGATLSVLCTEDVSRLAYRPRPDRTQESFLGDAAIRDWESLCEGWGVFPGRQMATRSVTRAACLRCAVALSPAHGFCHGDFEAVSTSVIAMPAACLRKASP